MDIRAMGPLEIRYNGRECNLGSPKQRCVLAVLLSEMGRPVTVERLMERVWGEGEQLPGVATLHSYLSRLRKSLREVVGDRIRIDSPAASTYRLDTDPDAVDLLRFRLLSRQARATAARGDREQAVELLREAEALWRGEPFAEFGGAWAASARVRLQEELRRIREERIGLELELGQHADLIGELQELVADHPFSESAVGRLMLALYRCDRREEALDVYRTTHRRWNEQRGLRPGPRLVRLHRRVLDDDPSLHPPEPSPAPCPPPRPNTLPRDIRDFTGREAELRILLEPNDEDSTALPLTVVHGMAGVGKSALVIHAAHLLADRYPDGVFHVDLRTHDQQPPLDPGDALGALLSALGVSKRDLEGAGAGIDGRAALWRQWTASRAVLLVIDDARDAAQVRPLLPGSPGCRVLITNRNRMPHLEGARSVALEALSVAQSAVLFTRVAGASRLSDTAALHRAVQLCGCHPLAIRLTAARFRHRDGWDLAEFVDRLSRAADLLDEIDTRSLITMAFDSSYAELGENEGRVFRYAALHPGPDLTPRAVAALAGGDTAGVRRSLETLLDCHLLEEFGRERYRFHDLVRNFALRMAGGQETKGARSAAVRRLLSFYLVSADRADRLAHPLRRRLELESEHMSSYAEDFADADEATAWLDIERPNLLAAARAAAAASPAHAACFPHVLAQALSTWGAWEAAIELGGTALTVRRESGDRPALAQLLVEHAEVLAHGAHEEALRCAREALEIFRECGDRRGEADGLQQAGRAQLAAGRSVDALRCFDAALPLHRLVGNPQGEAETLNTYAVVLAMTGQHGEAAQRFRAVLAIHGRTGDRSGRMKALNNIGEVRYLQGRYEEARGYFDRSLRLARLLGARRELANLHNNLANVYRANGETEQALGYYRKALKSYRASKDARGEADTLINMADAYREAGRSTEARVHYTDAECLARRIGNSYERQRALLGIAATQREADQDEAALDSYQEALRLAEAIGVPPGRAAALDGIHQTLLRTAGVETAREYGEQALALYEQLGADQDAAAVRRRLAGPGAAAVS